MSSDPREIKGAQFGFEARYEKGDGVDPEGWSVYLPHQCGEWIISSEPWGPDVPLDQAVDRLAAFIAEAKAVLRRLRRGEETRFLR